MHGARAIALRAWLAVFPRRLQFAAGAGSLRIHRAMRFDPDFAAQRDAMRSFRPGATHRQAVRIEAFGQVHGQAVAACARYGLGPVEGDDEGGAAGAAGQAGMRAGHAPLSATMRA